MSKTSSLSLLEALDNLNTFSSASSTQDIALCQDFDLNLPGIELHVSSVMGFACDLSQKELEQMVHNTLVVVSDHLKEASKMQKRSAQLQLKVTKTTASMMQLSMGALQNLGQILPSGVGEHLQKSDAMQQVSQLHRKAFGDRKVTSIKAHTVSKVKSKPYVEGLHELGQKELHHILHHLEYLFEDTLYELYFLQKASGPFWLDQELLHHMQAYEDFHELLANHSKHDPLYQALCKVYSMKARFIWSDCEEEIHQFLQSNVNSHDYPLSNHVRKALVALKLAAFMHEEGSDLTAKKQSYHYGSDFLVFLRDALNDESWKKIALDCRKGEKVSRWMPLYNLVTSWLETTLHFEEITISSGVLSNLPFASETTIEGVWGLEQVSRALDLYVEKKTMGVFQRSLEQIQMWRRYYGFDPHLMGHSPCAVRGLSLKGCEITQWLMASPITQIRVENAAVCPEWSKDYVGTNSLKRERALWLDVQTPSSWLDQARTQTTRHWAQEEGLPLVSMPLNSAFSTSAVEASIFMSSLKEFMSDPSNYFDLAHSHENSIEGVMLCIWRNFFSMKNALTNHEQRAFVDLLSIVLLLRAVNQGDHKSLVCLSKDGLDASLFIVSTLVMVAKLYQEGRWKKEDFTEILNLLHTRPLLYRCRPFLADHLQRLCQLLAVFEEMANIYGHEAFVRAMNQCWQAVGGKGPLDLQWKA